MFHEIGIISISIDPFSDKVTKPSVGNYPFLVKLFSAPSLNWYFSELRQAYQMVTFLFPCTMENGGAIDHNCNCCIRIRYSDYNCDVSTVPIPAVADEKPPW